MKMPTKYVIGCKSPNLIKKMFIFLNSIILVIQIVINDPGYRQMAHVSVAPPTGQMP